MPDQSKPSAEKGRFGRIADFLATPFVLIIGIVDTAGGLLFGRDGLLILGLVLLILYVIFALIVPRIRK